MLDVGIDGEWTERKEAPMKRHLQSLDRVATIVHLAESTLYGTAMQKRAEISSIYLV